MFTASFFPRSLEVVKAINQGVAFRHLSFNQATEGQTRSSIFRKEFYYSGHHLEFRTEEATPVPYRVKAILTAEDRKVLESVPVHQILRKVMRHATQLVPEYAVEGSDVLFQCSNIGYFVSEEEARNEILAAIYHARKLKKPVECSARECRFSSKVEMYAIGLHGSFIGRDHVLDRNLHILENQFRSPESELRFLIDTEKSDKKGHFKACRRIQSKKWATEQELDVSIVRLLCTIYIDLLSAYRELHLLPSIQSQTRAFLNNTSSPRFS